MIHVNNLLKQEINIATVGSTFFGKFGLEIFLRIEKFSGPMYVLWYFVQLSDDYPQCFDTEEPSLSQLSYF